MILPLRRGHRRIFTVLCVLLPAALVTGLAGRRPFATFRPSNEVSSEHDLFTKVLWDRGDLFPKSAVRVQLLQEGGNTNHFAIQLSAPKDFLKPDLLVYLLPSGSIAKEKIPDEAVLLGAFGPNQQLRLPYGGRGKSGVLVLYSLANGEVVESSTGF